MNQKDCDMRPALYAFILNTQFIKLLLNGAHSIIHPTIHMVIWQRPTSTGRHPPGRLFRSTFAPIIFNRIYLDYNIKY